MIEEAADLDPATLPDDAIVSFTDEHRFLSNFWPVSVSYGGETFPSAEHAYVWSKTLDPVEKAKVRAASSPGNVKRYGRRITLRPDWDDVRLAVMADIIGAKFEDHELRDLLAATGSRLLVEGNRWHDVFWGVCLGCKSCDGAPGANHLGGLLMTVRDQGVDGGRT